ncbi:MAG: hypothetical protein ACRC41_05255 [Sarcina sp.]
MTVHIKISEFDEKDLKSAYDLMMRKEKTDAARGIQFIKKIKENNEFNALVVVDQCNYFYYVVDRGTGLEIYDYDISNEKVLDIAYISVEHKHSRTLVADAIKDFYHMYFNAIK